MAEKKTITIVGAGLSGCFMAILLSRKGHTVILYEAYADPSVGAVDTGRSYNIQLYLRSIKALQKIGMWEAVKKSALKIEGYMTHLSDGELSYTKLSDKKNEILYQIHRQTLHTILLKKVQSLENVTVHFNKKFIFADHSSKSLYLKDMKTGELITTHADHVIGADGVHSHVRPFVQKRKAISFHQEIFPMACTEVTLTPSQTKSLGLTPFVTHRWPREHVMLIGFPNKDKSLTLMFTLPLEGKLSFQTLRTEESIKKFLHANYKDLQPVSELITHGILTNPIGRFTSTITSSWYERDFIVLIGDAAHSMIPFYGQGVNSAFEDCLVLGSQLERFDHDYEQAFSSFQTLRKPHTDVMQKLAMENFYILRDKTRSYTYLLRDKIQTGLAMCFPTFFMPPLYKLIIYSIEPYAKVFEKYHNQQRLSKSMVIGGVTGIFFVPYYTVTKMKQMKIKKLFNHSQFKTNFKQKAAVVFLIGK